MNVLIVGNGGREHALAYKIKQSNKLNELYFLPKNPGMASIAKELDISVTDYDNIIEACKKYNVDLCVIGPEQPLCDGLTDILQSNNIKVFGPNAKAALFEKSKSYTKKFLEKYNIPTAKYHETNDYNQAIKLIEEYTYPLVIKADGLAAGKGVIIVNNKQEAIEVLDMMLIKTNTEAYNKVVIEEFLTGFECSLLCFVDGKTIKPMVSVKDHKQVGENNTGPNTGGMGTVSPNPFLDKQAEDNFKQDILDPIMNALIKENIDYRGVLFIGLMIEDHKSKVLEFNVRFGDPETQCIMLRLETDLIDIIEACNNQTLDKLDIKYNDDTVACVVLASPNYPQDYTKNIKINNLDNIKDSIIFHAGTKLINNQLYNNGGRVLNICSKADTLNNALDIIYKDINKIDFKDKLYRKDIGLN